MNNRCNMQTNLLDFATTIRQSPNLDASWNCLLTELGRLGFIHAKYGFLIAAPERFRRDDLVIAGQFCEEWEGAQLKQLNWIENDYIADHLLRRETPLTFSRVYQLMDSGQLTPQQKKNHAIGRDVGMVNGVALPIRERNPIALGGISMEADRAMTAKEFRRHLKHVLPELKSLAELFHSNVSRPQMLDESRHPSRRELECLNWVMKGLRVQQIAHQMGTHPKTVEKQLANVRAKLGAKTNAQAATRALLMDLITP